MNCFYHEQQQAVSVCGVCKRRLCRNCSHELLEENSLQRGIICAHCFEDYIRRLDRYRTSLVIRWILGIVIFVGLLWNSTKDFWPVVITIWVAAWPMGLFTGNHSVNDFGCEGPFPRAYRPKRSWLASFLVGPFSFLYAIFTYFKLTRRIHRYRQELAEKEGHVLRP